MTKWPRLERTSRNCLPQLLHLQLCLPQHGAQDRAWLGFDHLQGWRLHSLHGQLFPVFDHRHSKDFSYVSTGFPVFQFMTIPSCPSTEYHCVEFSSIFFQFLPSGMHAGPISLREDFLPSLTTPGSVSHCASDVPWPSQLFAGFSLTCTVCPLFLQCGCRFGLLKLQGHGEGPVSPCHLRHCAMC